MPAVLLPSPPAPWAGLVLRHRRGHLLEAHAVHLLKLLQHLLEVLNKFGRRVRRGRAPALQALRDLLRELLDVLPERVYLEPLLLGVPPGPEQSNLLLELGHTRGELEHLALKALLPTTVVRRPGADPLGHLVVASRPVARHVLKHKKQTQKRNTLEVSVRPSSLTAHETETEGKKGTTDGRREGRQTTRHRGLRGRYRT
mmetsp:Transcript_4796/g.14307  ORF Transcript_4796/g.14307 Transcript_4796/m.14307 type:complete len:200 (+) Transcript_4796:523-1122(+)